MLRRMWRKGNLCTLVEIYIGSATMEISKKFPQKTENRTPLWSSNSTPGYIYKENENTNSRRYMHHSVHSNIIYNSQYMKTPCQVKDKWMNKL